MQDCGKVVQKLAGREDEKYKLCTTLCAPLRHGTRIVQVSFPLGVRCVGGAVRRCAIRSFSLPPAEVGCPFRRRGRGGRQTGAGCCARGRPPLPSPSPTLRTVLRPSAGGGAVVGRQPRGERTGRGGDCLVHSAFTHCDSAHKRYGSAHKRLCSALREGAAAFAFALPHPAHGGAGHGATTARTLFRSGANTPGEQPTGERYIIYTRAQARGRARFAQGGEQRCG